jgi:NADP-dependent 3-hydroxy acid dehydrogenase YdfG
MATQQLLGKVAIVTGATSGIGKATALALAQEGVKVAVTGRRVERLEELVEVIGDTGGRALAIRNDITDRAAVHEMVALVRKEWGQIDILINNSGVMLLGPALRADPTDWQRMVDTNLYGVLWATHAVLPHMVERQQGHIVQISSVAGRTTRPTGAVYNATKWGVNAFTDALRQEICHHNIRTTLIEPGIVATELREHITHDETRERTEAWADSIRQLQSEDIAKAVVYAVSQPEHVAINEILVRPTDQES